MPESNITVEESTGIGGVAAAIDALLTHPLWVIKVRLQSGQPFTLAPSVLYRSALLDAGSSILITAGLLGLNKHLQKTFFPNTPELSNNQKIPVAFAAGIGISPFICATEMVMVWQGQVMQWQGRKNFSFIKTSQFLVKNWGFRCLFTGLTATTIKESAAAAFLLGATPSLKAKILPLCPNDGMASLSASIVTGLGATVLTHGFDTAKTLQQTASPSLYFSFPAALKKIKKEKLITKGLAPRSLNAISSMLVLSYTIEKMENAITEYKQKTKTAKPR